MCGEKTIRYTMLKNEEGYNFIKKLKEEIEVGGAYVRVIEEPKLLIAEFWQCFDDELEIKEIHKAHIYHPKKEWE